MKHNRFLSTLSAFALAVALAPAPAFAQQGTGTNYETRLSSMEDSMRDLNGRLRSEERRVGKECS